MVETLTRHLDGSVFQVEVLCLHFRGELGDELEQAGIPISVLERRQTRLRADYLALLRIIAHLRNRQPHVVHTHNTEAFIEAGFAAKVARVPGLVHTDHGRQFPVERRYMLAERVMANFANAVVAVSDDGREKLKTYVKIPERKLVTINNGVDASRLGQRCDKPALMARLDIPTGATLVGLGARFTKVKGIEFLIRSLPMILHRHSDVFLVLAGYGPGESGLRSEAESLGVAHRVRFAGKVRSMAEVLGCLDIFVLPSLSEGLPMAILEAMGAEVPIVASRVGGVPSALEDGQSALLVPAGEPDALAGAINALLGSSELSARLAHHAKAVFVERFSASAMAEGYSRLYEAALERTGPSF